MSRFPAFLSVALVAGAAALASATSQDTQAQTAVATTLPQADASFVRVAAMSSATEIDSGKLAMSKSQDEDVKSFARQMIDDHTRLSRELKAALPPNVEVPENPDRAVLKSLQPLQGKQFDDAYIAKVGLQGHREAITAFEREAATGQVAQIKAAAAKALPTIQHHYQMAQELASKKGLSK